MDAGLIQLVFYRGSNCVVTAHLVNSTDPVLCGHGWPAVMSEISEEFTGIWGLGVYSVVFKKSDYFYSEP